MLSLTTFPACHASGSSLLSIIHPSTPTKGRAGEAALWHRGKWKILTAILSCAIPVLSRVSLDLVVSFLLLFLANEKLATSQCAGEVLTLHSGPQLLLLLFSWHLTYIFIYIHTYTDYEDLFTHSYSKKSYKKYCLYNLKTLTIKLFILEQALRFVVSPAVRGPVSPKIQRGEMKLTALEAAVGDYLGTGAAILACCWGENCCFLPPFSLFSAELC